MPELSSGIRRRCKQQTIKRFTVSMKRAPCYLVQSLLRFCLVPCALGGELDQTDLGCLLSIRLLVCYVLYHYTYYTHYMQDVKYLNLKESMTFVLSFSFLFVLLRVIIVLWTQSGKLNYT